MTKLNYVSIYFLSIIVVSCNNINDKTNKIEKKHETEYVSIKEPVEKELNKQTISNNFLDLNGLLKYQDYYPEIIPEILKYSLSEEIRIVRNEVFARKGYIFKDTILYRHFSNLSWYKPKFTLIDSIKLTNEERNLIDSLIKYENKNKNLTIENLREELRDVIIHMRKFPLILWDRFINTDQDIFDHSAHCFFSRYSIYQVDTTRGFYHCLISDWCGAEGPGCNSTEIYIINNDLKKMDYFNSSDIEISRVRKIDVGKFQYDAIDYNVVTSRSDDGIFENYKVEKDLIYTINEKGKINFNK